MDDFIFLLFWTLLGIFFLLRVLFALFFPDRFADGARNNLFINEREKALFPKSKAKQSKEADNPCSGNSKSPEKSSPETDTARRWQTSRDHAHPSSTENCPPHCRCSNDDNPKETN